MAASGAGKGSEKTFWEQFRTSEHWAVALARDILWIVALVGGIALALSLICGTWPAVVTIESESMVPHMNVGDLVVVVHKDRFGDLQAWDAGKTSGYRKFGDYGDVIIYRPNGIQDIWSSVGLLPFSQQHPIIHRAMTWTDDGQLQPLYLNFYRGAVTPAEYVPLRISNRTIDGYTVLYTGDLPPPPDSTAGSSDVIITTPSGQFLLPSAYIVPGSGYISYPGMVVSHGGYITKGDNNIASDQGYLSVADAGTVGPVQEEWVVGKALFAIPLIGLLPLYIREVAILLVVVMVLYEVYLRRRRSSSAGGNNGRISRKTTRK